MKELTSLVVLLCVVLLGRGGEREIVRELEKAGAIVEANGFGVGVVADQRVLRASLPLLCELRRLRTVHLVELDLTDEQLRSVCGLTWLTWLNLRGSTVTDARLEEVVRIRGLRRLDLERTSVTDAGVKALVVLTDLEYLCLDQTGVTDEGLLVLERMTQLKRVGLGFCPGVTDAGVDRLRKALPRCEVSR